MRVLHVIPSVAPCRGGPSEAVLAMCRALAIEGVQADIVTTNDNGPALLPLPTGTIQAYEGCRVCFLPRWSPSVAALREFQFSPHFSSWLRSALPDYDGLHVHAIFSYLSTRAMTMARAAGIPYVSRPLGQLDTWSLKQKPVKKGLYYHAVEKRNLMAAAAIHCTSETEALNVRTLLPWARTEVIPHGIETIPAIPDAPLRLRQSLGVTFDQPVFAFLSRWHPKKNIPLLLEALAGMKSQSWSLVLAGSGTDEYTATIREVILHHSLQDRVHCPGHIGGEDKALLLQGASAFVLPSAAENFGIAVAEALTCGLPVIVTEGVDLAPVVTQLDGGLVCKPTVESLRSCLQQMLLRKYDRGRLSQDAQRQFTWHASSQKLSALYRNLFASRLP